LKSPLKNKEDSKLSISNYNINELRGWIIDRFYQIEVSIDRIICEFYQPKKDKEFKKVILNSSIISFGGKIKILANIPYIETKIIEKIRRLSSIRNAFAHLPIHSHYELKMHKNKEGHHEISDINERLKLYVMKSNGRIKTADLSDLREEFYSLSNQVRDYFLNLNAKT
jgi:hypothetical protein